MNTRFKLSFITYLNQRRISRDSGFALPIAVMVGLCIVVVGMAVVIQAQGNKSKVSAQVTTNQAMAIAEAGATQYVNFLNNNRGLIPYPACANDPTSNTCSTKSWTTATNIPNIVASPSTSTVSPSPSTSCSSSGSNATLPPNYQSTTSSNISSWANTASSGNNSGWKDLPNGTGQYRLIGYRTYKDVSASSQMNPDTDAPTTVASGKLIVEGRVNQNGTGATATDGSNGGKARVEITIPVTATTASSGGSSGSGFPGLWARDFRSVGNATAYSNVWDSSGCITGATTMPSSRLGYVPISPLTLGTGVSATAKANNGNKDLYQLTSSNGTITPVSQAFPDLPGGNTWAASTETNKNSIDCGQASLSDQYPRTNDYDTTGKQYGSSTNPPAANATYIYNCSGGFTSKGSNINLGRTGQETLYFYVNGDLNANSNGNLVPYSASPTSPVTSPFTRSIFLIKGASQINGNGDVGDMRDSTAIQFYIYKVDPGTISTNGYDHSLEINGNGSFYGFYFAPFGNHTQKGTTDTTGIFWVKSIDFDGNNKIWQGSFDATRLIVTLPTPYTTYNLGGSPSAWKRVAVN